MARKVNYDKMNKTQLGAALTRKLSKEQLRALVGEHVEGGAGGGAAAAAERARELGGDPGSGMDDTYVQPDSIQEPGQTDEHGNLIQ